MDQFLCRLDEKAAEHRCVPFWSLNDKLEPDVLREQIRQMKSAGIGGFFMHARGGLETEYMSEDWLTCISACIDEAAKQDMDAWAYDENGWPSGFADGVVTAKGWEYWQKWLSVGIVAEDTSLVTPLMPPRRPGMPEMPVPAPFAPEHILGYYRVSDTNGYTRIVQPEQGAYAIFIGYNRYYIDILSKKVVAYFLEVTHDRYFARCGESAGKSWRGFFTDEPQYSNRGLPWSTDFVSVFAARYGYDILAHLPALLMPFGGCEQIRSDYWTLVSEMFTESFGKQVHDWCQAHHLEFTGHMMSEDSLMSQIGATSGVMQFYPYFDMPGMDFLGRRINSPIQPKQVGSVAEQLGRRALTETFALCGWDVSWEELKWIAEWQYVNGINVTCQHLAPYSLRGLRKRDYPPALSIQESWFPVYKHFNDYFSRLGAALSEGHADVRVLMLHPIHSAYVLTQLDRSRLADLDEAFLAATNLLADNHVDFHYGDESVMKQYASVEGNELIVGRCRYQAFVLPKSFNLTRSTFELLERFAANGGSLYALDETVPTMVDGRHDDRLDALMQKTVHLNGAADVVAKLGGYSFLDISENGEQCASVHYQKRLLDDGSVLYFLVNHDNENAHEVFVDFGEGSLTCADLAEMTEHPVSTVGGRAKLHFSPMQSWFFIQKPLPQIEKLSLGDSFTIKSTTLNALTLDFCDYRIDGGEWVENTAIIVLQRLLLERRKPCDIELRLRFHIEAEKISEMYACIETPELFRLELNGHALDGTKDCGCYIDQAFHKINILPYIRQGENVLTMSRPFTQKQHVYDMLFGENVHETELNKLTYDSELESVYLLGDFDVYSLSGYTYGERKATFTDGPFVIRDKRNTLARGDFGEQGYRFFSGILTVSQKLTVHKQPNTRYVLSFDKPWVPVFKLFCNGKEVKLFGWADYEIDLTDVLTDGENELAFELYASNRNLLGPHHYVLGESYFVGPSTFSNVPGWADPPGIDIWKDRYCFVHFGVR